MKRRSRPPAWRECPQGWDVALRALQHSYPGDIPETDIAVMRARSALRQAGELASQHGERGSSSAKARGEAS